MIETRQPRWLVCTECLTVRAGRYTEVPDGARVIGPGEIHDAETCIVYTNTAEYRQAIGVPTGSVAR